MVTQKRPPGFQKGKSGNPAGRKKGNRNKLGEDFLKDLHTDWEKHGKRVLEDTREQNPGVYLKVVASILPKETHHRHFLDDLKELTAEQLQQRLERVLKERAALDVKNQIEIRH